MDRTSGLGGRASARGRNIDEKKLIERERYTCIERERKKVWACIDARANGFWTCKERQREKDKFKLKKKTYCRA
jgi:hypothetical protein